jgi:lysophospholipase L1-like esterase
MRLRSTTPVVAVAAALALCSCGGDATPSGSAAGSAQRSATTTTSRTTATTASGVDAEHPEGVIALGHSGMTGFQSDPDNLGENVLANSWATGTNPAVNSVYQRLVAVRPRTQGLVANVSRNGEKADGLEFQVPAALKTVPTPALALVMILDNDIRCDGTDPAHLPEFRAQVRDAVQTIVEASPKVTVVLASAPGRPADYATAIATLPTTPVDLVGSEPCAMFSANRKVNPTEVKRLTSIIESYEAELERACEGIPQCHTDGGALARHPGGQLKEYGNDLGHPSLLGHARWAAAIWPVVSEAMGLG